MKKLLLVLMAALTFTASAFFCACGEDENSAGTNPPPASSGTDNSSSNNNLSNNNPSDKKEDDKQPVLQKFTGITFTDKTVTYDGKEQEITVTGTVPDGAKVAYTGNKATDAGEYNANVTITKDGYETLTLKAKLVINKAAFTGITFTDKTVNYDGNEHEITVTGTLPAGTNVVYTKNKATASGEYNATAKITNPNYTELVLNAKLTIKKNLANIAKNIVNSILSKPDAWSFMPEAMYRENMACASAPVNDFTSFVNVGSIGDKIIGKQLNVLYDGLIDTTSTLGYVDNIYTVANAIINAYQAFINDNPDNYAQFTGTVAGFKIKINLDGNNSLLLAGNSTFSAELGYNSDSGLKTGRIQATDGIALKYTYDENYLKFAVKKTVEGVGNIKQIEFSRNSNAVAGYMYEYTGTAEKNLKTSAVIASNAQTTVIMSNKRETDDMVIKGYEEIYSSVTGKYLGGEVKETVKLVNFDTLWFMMDDVQGFETVKVLPEQNDMNADTIYINGGNEAFVTKKVGGLTGRTASRRYDVEMKDVWYIVENNDGDKVKYEKVKASIPMVFVQVENADTFGEDVKSQNDALFTAEPVLPDYRVVTVNYDNLQELFDTVKENVTYADIDGFIGTKDGYFE